MGGCSSSSSVKIDESRKPRKDIERIELKTTTINRARTNDKETNDAVYDLQGRKLSEGQVMKGVYLKNGKKYMVK